MRTGFERHRYISHEKTLLNEKKKMKKTGKGRFSLSLVFAENLCYFNCAKLMTLDKAKAALSLKQPLEESHCCA